MERAWQECERHLLISLGIILLQLWQGLASSNSVICDKLLIPLRGKVENVPQMLDLIESTWPELELSVFNLVSHILVNEEERYDAMKLLEHSTIVQWRS